MKNKRYYEIYDAYGDGDICIYRFVTAVTDEWVAKDICKRYKSFKYEKREATTEEE